ncbi:MAG: hypothetical protein FWF90_06915 [Promicromonosporaceae bacterium]|nr:hypothetical protein [Promicromonosporaceae bacterium]
MTFFYDALVLVHFLGWAVVLGGYLAALKAPRMMSGVAHGALAALLAGTAMMGLIEAGVDGVPPAARFDLWGMRVKLILALVITVLAYVARRQGAKAERGTGTVCPWVKHGIGVLTLATVVIAVFWQ